MRLRRITAFVFFAIFVLGGACSTTAASSTPKQFNSDRYGFHFTYQSGHSVVIHEPCCVVRGRLINLSPFEVHVFSETDPRDSYGVIILVEPHDSRIDTTVQGYITREFHGDPPPSEYGRLDGKAAVVIEWPDQWTRGTYLFNNRYVYRVLCHDSRPERRAEPPCSLALRTIRFH